MIPSFRTRRREPARLGAALVLPWFLAGCVGMAPASAPVACGVAGPDIACTRHGAIRGVAEGDTLAFKGIPYAQPPVAALRWRAPEPPGPWAGLRDGSQFGAICPQLAGAEVVGNEDCLTLNIWRPRQAEGGPLPVMVFLTGGGNHAYSGQGAALFGGVNYNGHLLASKGAIYVSFNNRLGALGFLAHPALSAEHPRKISGNYGNLDQIAMLRWLQQNIAAFGGDPKRVFLFGTSADGGSICALMTAPAARGLFHGASLQSSVPTGCEMPTLAEAEAGTGRTVERALGCGADTAACLRGKSTAEVVRALPGTFGVLPRLYGPNVDGQVFPEQPLAVIARGAHAHMPVIIGNSTEETNLFVNGLGPVTDGASYDAALARVFGAVAVARIRGVYPPQAFPSPRHALVKLTTDAFFTCQSRRVAGVLSKSQREPVYRYLFAHALENDPEQKALGAVHTIEHAFLFAWEGKYKPTDTDLAIQRLMTGHWTELSRSGSLAGARPAWPASAPNDDYLVIATAPALGSGGADAQCGFWDTFPLPWPHL
ncbi:MAG: carboxylesterase family protein [Ramlibacter sp.]|nr:carboxylesterase family protein [Ramlibacter sp.]